MNPRTNQSELLGSTLAPRGKSHSWQRQHKAFVGSCPTTALNTRGREEYEGLQGLNCVRVNVYDASETPDKKRV